MDSYHVVNNHFGFWLCTCRVGLKHKICKHSLGIEILFHGREVSATAKSLKIGQRHGRGRPKRILTCYDRE